MQQDPVALLGRALAQTVELVEALPTDRAQAQTPCRSWNAGRLVSHLLHDLQQFKKRAEGVGPDWTIGFPDVEVERWVPDFRAGAEALLAAWRASDTADEESVRFTLAQQTAEFAVHSWDLARTTGRSTRTLDEAVAAASLAWAQGTLLPQYRGGEAEGRAFGPEVRVAEDLPVQDRLAAFFGRDPAEQPAAT